MLWRRPEYLSSFFVACLDAEAADFLRPDMWCGPCALRSLPSLSVTVGYRYGKILVLHSIKYKESYDTGRKGK